MHRIAKMEQRRWSGLQVGWTAITGSTVGFAALMLAAFGRARRVGMGLRSQEAEYS
jgi:hypothetical protein